MTPLKLAPLAALALAACAAPRPVVPDTRPGMPAFTGGETVTLPAPPPVPVDPSVRATILPGTDRPPPTLRAVEVVPGSGNVSLNFPAADVRVVANAVLGDLLRVPFTVAPGTTGNVTLVTSAAVPRAAVVGLLENALKAANLALTSANGVFTIQPLGSAQGVVGPTTAGFGSETIILQFVQADEMRKLLEPILPGVVSKADPGQNSIVITGTTGQRSSARDLLAQFDVNWLRQMSFALFVPQRTDARLIAPELDKLINAEGAPTRGLVRLIAMERLNGILAITAQRQYLDDVKRWIEILDREGKSAERRLFVYRVQNGRAKDLVRTLNIAFGNAVADGGGGGDTDAFALDGAARSGDSGTSIRTSAQGRNTEAVNQRTGRAEPAAITPRDRTTAAGRATANALQPGNDNITASISADETNNAVVVFGSPRDYAVIEDALRRLDILPYQVLIEAAITEVTLNDDLRYGVEWNFQAGDTNFALTNPPNTTVNPGRLSPGFSFFYLGNDIRVSLNALESRTKINVISAPKLLVLNNQTAALQVGNQVPITTQSAVGVVNPDSPIVNSVEYRDTGVILKVTPRVNASGLVLLDVAQEVSDVVENTVSGIDSPSISTRRISTSIAVQDGQVIALGGLITDTKSRGKDGLPLLSRIPLIGGLLFGRVNDTGRRTELLVLLRPRVLRSIEDGRAVTDELRAKIKTLEPIRSTGQLP